MGERVRGTGSTLTAPRVGSGPRARRRREPAAGPARPSAAAAPRLAAAAGLVAMLAASVAVAAGAAGGPSVLVPGGRRDFAGWIAGPLAGLGFDVSVGAAIALLVVMLAAYFVVLACSGAIGAGWVLGAIAALHAVFLLAPPLLSTDVFGYLAFARLWGLHGLDPYTHTISEIPRDAINLYLGPTWPKDLPAPYGPLLLAGSPLLAPLGLAAGLWALKATAAAAALGCVALVWTAARRLGIDAVRAAAFVGLNPLWLSWTVGGAHNDLLMMLVAMAGVNLALAGRERAGAAAVTVAVGVKATAGLLLVFLVAGARRRLGAAAGAAAGGVAVLALALAVFGADLAQYVPTLLEQGTGASRQSVPRDISRMLGSEQVLPGVERASGVIFAVALLAVAAAALRRPERWLEWAGWATLALLLTTTWLHVWYLAGLLPVAALAGSRRLQAATLGLTVLMAVVQLTR